MFAQLEAKPTKDLLAIYNQLSDKPLASWKNSKQLLIARIEAAYGARTVPEDSTPVDLPPTVTEVPVAKLTVVKPVVNATKTRTIREAALHWLCYADYYENGAEKSGPTNVVASDHPKARSVGITYLDVIANIQLEFPDCETSVACLRWYSVKVRAEELGYEGYRLCQRRPRAKPSKG